MSEADLLTRGPGPVRPLWPLSFRDYVLGRKYDYGRGSAASWEFIAFARGDRNFPHIASASELQDYLRKTGVPDELAIAARSVWSSYSALRSRNRGWVAGAFGRRA